MRSSHARAISTQHALVIATKMEARTKGDGRNPRRRRMARTWDSGREARRHIYKQIAEGGRPGLEEEKREAGVGAAADGYS
jgi:hypothetical protein